MDRPSLHELAALSAVATHRSFRRAAEVLGVSRSALSHTVVALEKTVGVRLLHRTTRSVSPTEAGAQLLERLAPVLRDLDAALDSLADARGKPTGTLRLNTTKSAMRTLLARVVPTFMAEYPGVELDLVTEGRLVDIVAQGFDAGVRLLDAVPRDMVAVKLGPSVRFVVVGAPRYLKSRPRPRVPDDLRAHRCVRHRLPSGKRFRWDFEKRGQVVEVDVPGVLTLDDTDLMIEAAAAGLGLAYVPETDAAPLVAKRKLVTTLDDWCPAIGGLALYYPGHRLPPSPLRAFVEVMRKMQRASDTRR